MKEKVPRKRNICSTWYVLDFLQIENPVKKIHKEIFQNIRGYINVKPKCIEIIKVSKCLLQLMVTEYLGNHKNANKAYPEIYLISYNLAVIKKADSIIQ